MVTGKDFDSLARKLKALGKGARRTKRRALGAVSKSLVKGLKPIAPVLTGATKRSLGVIRAKNDVYYAGVRRSFTDKKTKKSPKKYAAYVERQRPWMGPYLEQAQEGLLSEMVTAFEREIEKERMKK